MSNHSILTYEMTLEDEDNEETSLLGRAVETELSCALVLAPFLIVVFTLHP